MRKCQNYWYFNIYVNFIVTLFTDCGESILDIMTDVTHEYFEQITKLLRTAVDNEAMRGSTGFPVSIQNGLIHVI